MERSRRRSGRVRDTTGRGHGRAVATWLLAIGTGGVLALGLTGSALGRPSQAVRAAGGGVYTEQGLKLVGAGETSGGGFGQTVAISADGNTALIGAYEDNQFAGAVWIFARTPTGWTQQSGKLTASEPGDEHFGESLALSGDGNTALVGAPSAGAQQTGAAWVFTRSGSTWTQGPKLTSGPNSDSFGASVALSGDGTTALIGSANSAQVFIRSGATWTQQGQTLTGIGATGAAGFGSSAALSSDGNTALVGGEADSASKGAVWVFTRSGGAWHLGPMLTGGSEVGAARFGEDVALSGDGATALVGGPEDNSLAGAAWVFSRTGGTWTQQGPKLTEVGGTGNGHFGSSVALSSDGNTALVGAPVDDGGKGGAWVFTRSGGAWHKGQTLIGSENAITLFGTGVALSGGGETSLVGGAAGQGNGEAWVFVVEAVTGLSPATGPASGGTPVKISGSGFAAATSVTFGGKPATLFKVDSDSQISAVAPPAQAGAVDVIVTVPGGATPASTTDRFTYTSPTTTTGSTTTTTTTTKATPSTTTSKGPVARIVSALVRGSGKTRTLTVRIRVSEAATARLVLLAHGKQKLARSFRVKGGGNTLKALLAASIPKGADRLTIVLTDQKQRRHRYGIAVSVPA